MRTVTVDVSECGENCPYYKVFGNFRVKAECYDPKQIYRGRPRLIFWETKMIAGFPLWCELEIAGEGDNE